MPDSLYYSCTSTINIFRLLSLLGYDVWILQSLSQPTSDFICCTATVRKYIMGPLCPETKHVSMKYG